MLERMVSTEHAQTTMSDNIYFTTGSYSGAGYLLTSLDMPADATEYARWLDLDQAVARVQWMNGNQSLSR